MDRVIIYPGAIPLETDLLNAQRNSMVSLASLASALFGSVTTANGLACSAAAPSNLTVTVGPGEIYAVENLDSTAYSSLPADTTHQIVKQGINIGSTTLACPAPGTVGTSINYLIEASFSEADTNDVALPYYNASNPSVAYTGPANSGAAQPTMRSASVVLTAKAGIAAATGSQTTPAADSGSTGLWVVTVAYGQTAIAAGNIAAATNASIVPSGGILAALKAISYASRAVTKAGTSTTQGVTPDGLAQSIQSGSFLFGAATGSANALAVALTPAPAALVAGMEVVVKASATNTAAATLNVSSLGAAPITMNGSALRAGSIKSGQSVKLVYDGTSWQLIAPSADGIIAYQQGATGYRIFSNGDIEQWGGGTSDSSGKYVVTFPVPFPVACDNVQVSNLASGPPSAFHGFSSPTTTGMTVWAASSSSVATTGAASAWRAIGR